MPLENYLHKIALYWHLPECYFYKSETGCKAGELDLFVTVMLLEEKHRSAFIRETLRRTWVHVSLEKRSKSASHQKWQEN